MIVYLSGILSILRSFPLVRPAISVEGVQRSPNGNSSKYDSSKYDSSKYDSSKGISSKGVSSKHRRSAVIDKCHHPTSVECSSVNGDLYMTFENNDCKSSGAVKQINNHLY